MATQSSTMNVIRWGAPKLAAIGATLFCFDVFRAIGATLVCFDVFRAIGATLVRFEVLRI